jgi:serralysin
VFRYQDIAESTNAAPDHILDFTSNVDKIDLHLIDANTNVSGDQAFTFIGASAFDGHAGELRAVDSGLGYYNVEGDVNGDGIADFTIHVTMGTTGPSLHPLVGTDFIP